MKMVIIYGCRQKGLDLGIGSHRYMCGCGVVLETEILSRTKTH
jgi:hypothetical protein